MNERIFAGIFLGKCECGKINRVKVDPAQFKAGWSVFLNGKTNILCARCECGRLVYLKALLSRVTDKPCGGGCMNAYGPTCDCSCGGENHGSRG